MCKKQICFCLALVLGVASNGYAGVIGDWETGYDGWGNWVSSAVANTPHEHSP